MKTLTPEGAAGLLNVGQVVAIPTETVYGLAADATSHMAVEKIFIAKGRPSDNPLIVHIANVADVFKLAKNINGSAQQLMKAFWPGALSLILEDAGVVCQAVTAGLSTVAIRMPSHPLALEIIKLSGRPLAAPSANLSGKPSATNPAHVANDFGDTIAGIVDGGKCPGGLESTVIDMTVTPPTILRLGHVSEAQISAVIGAVVVADHRASAQIEGPKAPGMKYRHYAPSAPLYIMNGTPYFIKNHLKKMPQSKIGILCYAEHENHYQQDTIPIVLAPYGQNLYEALRTFDEMQVDIILSETFLHPALMDRLMKASEEKVIHEMENS